MPSSGTALRVEHIDPGVPARGLAHWSRRKNTLVRMGIESMLPEAFSGRFAQPMAMVCARRDHGHAAQVRCRKTFWSGSKNDLLQEKKARATPHPNPPSAIVSTKKPRWTPPNCPFPLAQPRHITLYREGGPRRRLTVLGTLRFA